MDRAKQKQESFHFERKYVPSASLKMAVRELSKVDPWRALRPLLFDWVLIVGAISLAVRSDSALAYFFAVLVIGVCQHALLIIVHEGVHYRLSDHRSVNEWASDFLAAFPIFFCTHGYRLNHLAHHRYLNTADDPDWARKVHLSEWRFPKEKADLAMTMAGVALTSWYKMILLFWRLSGIGRAGSWSDPVMRTVLLKKVFFYAVVVALVTATGTWAGFFAYWLVPYLFVMPIVERVRSISEHFGLDYGHDLKQTRNILCSRFEGAIFGPHNIRYHLVHHLFPTVPQYNLPKLQEQLMSDATYSAHSHQNRSYLMGKQSVLKDILATKGPERC